MLTNSLKVSDTTKNDFFELVFFKSTKKNDKNTAKQIQTVFNTL